MRGGRLGWVAVAVACAAVPAPAPAAHDGPFCEDVGVHENHKDQEGYGNQLHALILAAELARACDLTLVVPRGGRLGHVCSRLGCAGAVRRDFGRPPRTDFEIVYMPGFGARCHAKQSASK